MDDQVSYSTENCSIARTLQLVGERWTLLILREAFYGNRRFEQFQARTGVARNLLATRLATLVEHGILDRQSYQEPGQRARQEYRLTAKGKELYPILVALLDWGDRHVADPAGPAVLLHHRDCGAPVHTDLRCDAGHEHLAARDISPTPGPGARQLA
ncbi:winged helix-turn-helix transcriptional regulator [Kutzneria sp. NPDC052558]|uniref:winged helix-turn-helix transcriptional regulator n=1 Tax=Kutzneria sp. NPDC052558 TaxID=3364121 RepID=UPI0037CBC65F